MNENLDYNRILRISSLAGKIMLASGGEIYRVEQTVAYMCSAFGAVGCTCYAAPTVLILSLIGPDGQIYTNMVRITDRTIDLNKVDEINAFSRALGEKLPTLDEAEAQLERIKEERVYSTPILIGASALIAGGFAVVFGGSLLDFACALVSGAIVRILLMILDYLELNSFFVNMAGGMTSAICGWFFVLVGIGQHQSIITISTLMLLVPGLLITNAIRDIAAGDLVSGTSRSIEAFFIAVAISSGAGLVYSLLLRIGGGL